MASVRPEFTYDPFSIEAMTDPQPLYRQLRDAWPVYPLPQYRSWAIARFADVWSLFLDRERFTEAEGQVFARELLLAPTAGTVPVASIEPLAIFNNLDPPVHGDVRRAMGASLMPGSVNKFEPMLRAIVNRRLDLLEEQGRLDANLDLASHVSAGAACHIVGLPAEDIPELIALVNRSVARKPGEPGMSEDGWAAVGELNAILTAAVARRRAGGLTGDPRMIDGLIAARLPGRGPLSDQEIGQQLISILIGGTESLPKVVSGGLIELWLAKDQRAAVAADPAANAGRAFEEMIRFCAPAQWFGRTLKIDGEISGQAMRAGERVLLLTASANRDDREFDDPDRFRWDRSMRRVVAFGMGPHFCIGIHIARLEGRLIVEELLRRFPDYELDMEAGERAISEFQIGWVRLPIIVR
ncbi:cytochrome P450 [Flavisphingomonas formosensis]|uniref:cytochrome P450 n=1 Tax=Flavisphingomonas formosensis TaxID=861534 RepID=UPI0012FBE478|nr:cytochrome P450 [Sphingomonas formosensis]